MATGVYEAFMTIAGLVLPTVFGVHIEAPDVADLMRRDVSFRAASADVANWRFEAARHLDLSPKATLFILFDAAPVPRCVKLNNYWCIKRGRWNGELGADLKGHVGFESAPAGARAAALLLRRYYLEFGRRSATEIVSHWAPDRCSRGPVVRARMRPHSASAPAARIAWSSMSPSERARTAERLIAARRKAAEMRKPLLSRAGEAAAKVDARPPPDIPLPQARPGDAGSFTCAGEAIRISAYARRVIQGVVSTPDEDLGLVASDGRSTWRMARVLENMAAVEIGPREVDPSLISVALSRIDGMMVP